MLTYIRIVMLLLLTFIYYLKIPEQNNVLKFYVIAAALIYLFNHFRLYSIKGEKQLTVIIIVDALISFSFGFLFPGSTLYLILLGVVTVTLFIGISNKTMLALSMGLFSLLWAGMMFYWWRTIGSFYFWENLISFSFVVFGAVVGDLIRKLHAALDTLNKQYDQVNISHRALSEAHGQLEIYSKQVEELTTIRERNRVAREIHDTVGHKMTALLVQLQLGRELLKLDVHTAEEKLVVCEQLARDALQEIRFSVRTLHDDEGEQLTLIQSIRKLLDDFYKTAELATVFELKGDPATIPVSLQPTIIRTIQEALTNAKRHGNAAAFFLNIECSGEEVILLTKDNGTGVKSIEPGFGLINMRERIEEHGGSVLFESIEGEGFRMRAQFPLLQRKWISGGSK
ncbi:sensor histidine kinase [Bacillus canaveralius]|uniref:histidine kinase n=1 Tax=Bacillus canaveralius TaxID=1403243 RepID=A0A2N5GQN5_9BACI|nr:MULTISPECIES: sensor histidine kinase [Bacillus]PLR85150.1 sensor histidine kinase [Bacillus sp. V33-4]PLR85396.1 sensor histidine kinase [Bacillus canaveralius]PLR94969.1 sensor histidine kinase [Bacillus canaveralius]RSK48153.1 sensor histidine kinase [Bacillus canaveralius]